MTPSPPRSTLTFRGVKKAFRGVHAIDGIDLELSQGEIVGLIGPNGSGKTTLLNVASGLLKPTAGQVLIEGEKASGRRPHVLARMGIGRTFQQIRLFGEMTVAQNVEVGALAAGQGPSRSIEVLERLSLQHMAARPASTLAYGQQRRVEIARALAGRPRFLLLDEPAAGMHSGESAQLLAELRRIRDQEGCALLIVDHDLRLIMQLCERVHVLVEGHTAADGPPAEVQRDPRVIEAYLGSSPIQTEATQNGGPKDEEENHGSK